MQAILKRFHSEESGQIIVLVAVSMVMLFGLGALAADIGRLYLERQRLTSAADLAALSAAQYLPDKVAAEQAARDYLAKNGVDGSAATIVVNESTKEVGVAVNNTIPMTFAVMMGSVREGTLGEALARMDNVSGVFGAAPLGVAQADWQVGDQVVLKLSANDGSVAPGNYQALALGKSGASMYEYNLMNGFQDWIRIDQWLQTETGNMTNPTVRASRYRIQQDPGATWETVNKSSPRLLKVPVLESFQVNGKGEVRVVGFAMFFLEGVMETGADKGEIYGRFLRGVVEGEANGSAQDYGLKTVKLVR